MNFKKLQKILFIMMTSSCGFSQGQNGVTYSFTQGRTGDHIAAYIESRWIAFDKGLDFYYRPFVYSQDLVMHTVHKRYDTHKLKEQHLSDASLIDLNAQETLFVMEPFPDKNPIGWDNYEFISLIQKEIHPIKGAPKIKTPPGYKSIALHIRRGGGFDGPLWQTPENAMRSFELPAESYNIQESEYQDKVYPHKTPSDAWYIQMLQFVRKLYPLQPFYVYIFTDDPCPKMFADAYQKSLNDPLMMFDYRDENAHDKNVLDDFFALMQFEIVIRGQSWFSCLAGNLGRPAIEIKPTEHRWEGRKLIITEIVVRKRTNDIDNFDTHSVYLKEW